MGTGDLPRGKCGRSVLLTTHALLLQWVKQERGYTSSPPMRENCYIKGNLYIYLPFIIKTKTTKKVVINLLDLDDFSPVLRSTSYVKSVIPVWKFNLVYYVLTPVIAYLLFCSA
jgi:hypothetical protein